MENHNPTHGEVFPSDKSPVITQNNEGIAFESATFGFKWDGKGVVINRREPCS